MSTTIFTLLATFWLAAPPALPPNALADGEQGIYHNELTSLEQVLRLAAANDKLVLLDFHARWCVPCQMFDHEVLQNAELRGQLQAELIIYKVDVEKGNGAALAQIYGIRALPTLGIITPEGRPWRQRTGLPSRKRLLAFVQEARTAYAQGWMMGPFEPIPLD